MSLLTETGRIISDIQQGTITPRKTIMNKGISLDGQEKPKAIK